MTAFLASLKDPAYVKFTGLMGELSTCVFLFSLSAGKKSFYALEIIQSIYLLFSRNNPKINRFYHLQILKNAIKVIATYIDLKLGLFVNTTLPLGKNLNNLRFIKSRTDFFLKILPIVSKILYLSTLLPLPVSKRVYSHLVVASLALDIGAYFVLIPIHARKAHQSVDSKVKLEHNISAIRCLFSLVSRVYQTYKYVNSLDHQYREGLWRRL